MPRYKNTDDEIREAVAKALSIRQVLLRLGRNPNGGGGYETILKQIKRLGLNTLHFTGKLWSKGKTLCPKRPISDYLSNKFPIQSFRLKQRLINEGLKEYKCECCGLTVWLNKPIPIELHHRNGNHKDNQLENILFLCPNCHAQTDDFAGKGKGKIGREGT